MQYSPESDSEDELPPGWEERATLAGEVYYVNHVQSTTQWTHPRTGSVKTVSHNLPFGWERRILEDNKVVYVDHQNKRTTFTDPRLAFAAEKKKEQSFRQKHDASTTALQVLHGVDLTGKLCVLTGASSGIGFQVSRALALHGAQVVMAGRSQAKADKAISCIMKERPQAKCSFLHVDLSRFTSVELFAKRLSVQFPEIDYLVLNAGVFGHPYELTEDGLDYTMQVNYLSNFYLVKLLFNTLTSSQTSITIVSSESHRFAEVSLESLVELNLTPLPSKFNSTSQYNLSKLYCILFAQSLHNMCNLKYGMRCTAVHPGNLVSTDLQSSWWMYRLLAMVVRPFTKNTQQAAASVVFALCSDDISNIEGFVYINNCFPTRPSQLVEDTRFGEKLWQVSTEILKVKGRA